MKKFSRIAGLLLFLSASQVYSQNAEVINDTIYCKIDVNAPIQFSKAKGKIVHIADIIPADLPPKSLKLQIISANGQEIDVKQVQVVDNKHLIIPLELFTERFYTLYIKKGNATVSGKKIIIK